MTLNDDDGDDIGKVNNGNTVHSNTYRTGNGRTSTSASPLRSRSRPIMSMLSTLLTLLKFIRKSSSSSLVITVFSVIIFYSISTSTVLISYTATTSSTTRTSDAATVMTPRSGTGSGSNIFNDSAASRRSTGIRGHGSGRDSGSNRVLPSPPMFLPPGGKTSTTSSSTTSSTSTRTTSFSTSPLHTSACLLVMDDNHFLIEWLAYHYHTMDLRNLIVAVDPKSFTSPSHILDRWAGKMTSIVQWHDGDYMTRDEFTKVQKDVESYFSKTTPELVEHRARQRLFYTKCLQTFKRAGVHWTMLIDTDEYMTINYDTAYESPAILEGGEGGDDGSNKNRKKNHNVTVSAIPPSTLDVPGSIIKFLDDNAMQDKQTRQVKVSDNTPLFILQSSPCVQIPRIRYVDDDNDGDLDNGSIVVKRSHDNRDNSTDNFGMESTKTSTSSSLISSFDPQDLMTVRYKRHSLHTDLRQNKISKTILDLSRMTMNDLGGGSDFTGIGGGVDSIHLPVRKYCQQRRLHIQQPQSMLVIRHYLGTYNQFMYREGDARIERNKLKHRTTVDESWEEYSKHRNLKRSLVDGQDRNQSLSPWLTGFLENNADSIQLLEGVGRLEAKSWRTHEGNPNLDRCALLFFGLPRSFQSLVLPSIKKNLFLPNARHNCDVFVHYYQQKEEAQGRRNRGGIIDSENIHLLNKAVKTIAATHGPKTGRNSVAVTPLDNDAPQSGSSLQSRTTRQPIVAFVHDTPEEYWERRGELVRKYQETIDPHDGKPMYFPWKTQTYTNTSIDNIVRQWHSISTAFQLMDMTAKQLNLTYTRVGMFRSDVMYLTPIDIASLDGGMDSESGNNKIHRFHEPHMDTQNHFFVLAPFATYPVNDRSIYGPYKAVKVWATQRFRLLDERAKERKQPGFTMHSERFLNDMVLPEMQKLGYGRHTNPDICFLRTRADESVIVSDCSRDGSTRNWDISKSMTMVNEIVGKQCQPFTMGKKFRFLGCGEGQDYKNGPQD